MKMQALLLIDLCTEFGYNHEEVKNDKMKIDTATNEMTVIPGVTGQDVEAFMGSEITIKNSKGEELDKKIDDRLNEKIQFIDNTEIEKLF